MALRGYWRNRVEQKAAAKAKLYGDGFFFERQLSQLNRSEPVVYGRATMTLKTHRVRICFSCRAVIIRDTVVDCVRCGAHI